MKRTVAFLLFLCFQVLVRGQEGDVPKSPFEAIPAAVKQLREAPNSARLMQLYADFCRDFPKDKFGQLGFLMDEAYAATATKLMDWKEPAPLVYILEIGNNAKRWNLMNNLEESSWKSPMNIRLIDSVASLLEAAGNRDKRLTLVYTELIAFSKGQQEAFKYLAEADPDFAWKLEHPDLYVTLFRANGRPEDALAIMGSRVKSGFADASMKELLHTVWLETGRSKDGYADYYDTLLADVRQQKAKIVDAHEVHYDAPAFEVRALDGRTVRLTDLKGKVVVLDFWATWCGPCIASFAMMKELVDEFADRSDVVFLFVNTMEKDSGDRQAKIQAFLKERGIDLPVVFDHKVDGSYELLTKYKVNGIPAQFVIDRDGQVRFATKGYDGSSDGFKQEIKLMIDRAGAPMIINNVHLGSNKTKL